MKTEVIHFVEEINRDDVAFSLHHIRDYEISICLIIGDVNLEHLELIF